jgi:hypothetical protein
MIRNLRLAAAALAVPALALAARAEPVLQEGFEQEGKWHKTLRGPGAVELVAGGLRGKCLKVTSRKRALAYYSIALQPKRVRGKRLTIRARVKLDNVVQGPEIYSTAKIHVGVTVGGRVEHRAKRFVGTSEWHHEVLIAPIPDNAEKVVLDLGIQNGSGTAWFDDLVVDDGVKEHVPLSLHTVANTNSRDRVAGDGRGGFLDAGAMDLRDVPVAGVRLAGVDFHVMPADENYGRTCVVLRGRKRPRLPARIETVVPVGRKGSRLYFLQAAAWADVKSRRPSLVCRVHYADGKSLPVTMREGVEIGSFELPKDLPNWKVAWTTKRDGRTLGLGVTTWVNPRPDVPIRFLRLSTPGTGGAPVLVAVSLDPKVR